MRSTKVSITNPAIKKIVDATAGKTLRERFPQASRDTPYRGLVVVRETTDPLADEVPPGTDAWYVDLAALLGSGVVRVRKPEALSSKRMGKISANLSAHYVTHRVLRVPERSEALVRWVKGMEDASFNGIEIIIPEDAIDSAAVAVAADALLARDKKKAQEAASACGGTAGLCMALAEANAKALKTGEGRVGERRMKSAAQLDREIAAALSRR